MDYFCDYQIRRYLVQFLRVFSDIKVRSDANANGMQLETRVPIKHGDMSRLIAAIASQNTENVTISAPLMSGYITAIALSNERRASPMLTTKAQVNELDFNQTSQTYGEVIGNRYTIERYMPVPYDLTLKLDILTTNNDTKMQILEQILTVFNPSVQLTQNENPLDWTSVFELELTGITWTNRNMPLGADTSHDVASLEFKLQIWINPPAIETRQKIIEKIITRVYDSDDSPAEFEDPFPTPNQLLNTVVTPGNLKIKVEPFSDKYKITLLNSSGHEDPNITWQSQMSALHTSIKPLTTAINLKTNDNVEDNSGDINAVVQSFDSNPATLIVTIANDSLPHTISSSPVSAVIDPTHQHPGNGLPIASLGQKYLIAQETSNGDPAISQHNSFWGNIKAHNNDIIECTASGWIVRFNSQNEPGGQYVVDASSQQHYKFTGSEWVHTFLGEYNPGYWNVLNLNLDN